MGVLTAFLFISGIFGATAARANTPLCAREALAMKTSDAKRLLTTAQVVKLCADADKTITSVDCFKNVREITEEITAPMPVVAPVFSIDQMVEMCARAKP